MDRSDGFVGEEARIDLIFCSVTGGLMMSEVVNSAMMQWGVDLDAADLVTRIWDSEVRSIEWWRHRLCWQPSTNDALSLRRSSYELSLYCLIFIARIQQIWRETYDVAGLDTVGFIRQVH